MNHDVFISYSRRDKATADSICAALDRAGISYFIDRVGVEGGEEIFEKLADAILGCRVFLYLASENSYQSSYTMKEVNFAMSEKIKVLPYVIDGSKMPGKMRLVFSDINWRTIEEHPVDTVLLKDLNTMLGRNAGYPVRPSRVPGGGGGVTLSQPEIDKLKKDADALYNDKRFVEANNLYIKAADAGDSWSQFRVAWMADCGEGVTKDRQTAIKYYTKSANSGYSYAQFNLGIIYDVELKDKKEAYKWYLKAAEQGHSSAMLNLSFLLVKGEGCVKDEAAAFRWHRKLADLKDDRGYNSLGIDYEEGRGVSKDLGKAIYYYRLSADLGNRSALANLGTCYEKGKGVTKDIEKALGYYRRAAALGNKKAQDAVDRLEKSAAAAGSAVSVEEIVRTADNFYDAKEYAEAYKLYIKAADRGDSWAQFRVGWMANNAEGTSKDIDTARKYYRMSADNGYRYAQYNLALIYQNDKNYEEECRLYRKAAVQEHESSMYWLGMALREGKGCTKDEREAHMWFSKLADKGDSRGLSALGDDYYYGYGVEIDNKKAADCYRKSADKGHAYSMYSLGWCYEKGKGVAADLVEARRWYRKAADAGNDSAKRALDRLGSGNAAGSLSSMSEKELIDKANALYNDKNYAEALRYYEACVSRFPNGSVWNRMGFMYETAMGTAADYNAAKKYYELAAEKGDASAWVSVGHLYYSGKLAQDYSQAEKYYQKADAKGNADGAAWTGVLYHYGLGRPVDKVVARRYYDRAVSLGSKFAEEQRAKL